jgi:hypothetical protein
MKKEDGEGQTPSLKFWWQSKQRIRVLFSALFSSQNKK